MLSTVLIVLPIFALVAVGWIARQTNVLGCHATSELNRFVVCIALPALLFDMMANARFQDMWQPGFAGAFGLSAIICFVLTVALRGRRARPLADAAIDALNASYSNTSFIGFPLVLVAVGREALLPTVIATVIVVGVILVATITLIEIGLEGEVQGARLATKVAGRLVRHPLILSPLLGTMVPLFGVSVPASVEKFLTLLGAAASPCALVAIGLFLAEPPKGKQRDDIGVSLIVCSKLLVQPALALGLAFLFKLPPMLTHTAVILAGLPTGTGPFMLAEFYNRDSDITGRVLLISTIVSVVTLSSYVATIR